MKCYMYYIKPLTIDEFNSKTNFNYINDTDEYILYAYTSSKKLAKKFEKQRKMDYFIKKIINIDEIPSKIVENKLVEKYSYIESKENLDKDDSTTQTTILLTETYQDKNDTRKSTKYIMSAETTSGGVTEFMMCLIPYLTKG